MQIFIKNMVCDRCIAAVQSIFDDLTIPVEHIHLGSAETAADLDESELTAQCRKTHRADKKRDYSADCRTGYSGRLCPV